VRLDCPDRRLVLFTFRVPLLAQLSSHHRSLVQRTWKAMVVHMMVPMVEVVVISVSDNKID
jgi:hypothetical protein